MSRPQILRTEIRFQLCATVANDVFAFDLADERVGSDCDLRFSICNSQSSIRTQLQNQRKQRNHITLAYLSLSVNISGRELGQESQSAPPALPVDQSLSVEFVSLLKLGILDSQYY